MQFYSNDTKRHLKLRYVFLSGATINVKCWRERQKKNLANTFVYAKELYISSLTFAHLLCLFVNANEKNHGKKAVDDGIKAFCHEPNLLSKNEQKRKYHQKTTTTPKLSDATPCTAAFFSSSEIFQRKMKSGEKNSCDSLMLSLTLVITTG